MPLARRIAAKSMVLLANDGTLPLAPSLGTVAVIGPNADSARNLLGDYAHAAHIEALLENAFGTVVPDGLAVADELAGHATVLDAIRTRFGSGTHIRYAAGCGVLDGDDAGILAAADAARGADVAIVVVGERSGLTRDCTCGETRDRLDIGLPGRQSELVAAVAATGTPVVLVLVAGRPLAIEREAAEVAAIVHAWVPGEEGPEALADVLFGVVDPGGSCRSRCRATSARSRSTTATSRLAASPTGTARMSTARTSLSGRSASGSRTPNSRLRNLRVDSANRPDRRRVPRSASTWQTSAIEPATKSSNSMSATKRPASRVRSRSCAASSVSAWRPVRPHGPFRAGRGQLAFTGVDGKLRLEPGLVTLMAGSLSRICRARRRSRDHRRPTPGREPGFSLLHPRHRGLAAGARAPEECGSRSAGT